MTGLNFPTVAITIPFFHPLYPGEMWPALFMIFITSTVGYTISPLHLCLILTREFFDADLLRTYSYILPPAGDPRDGGAGGFADRINIRGAPMYQLVVLDLDMTIIDRNLAIPPRTRQVVADLRTAG